MMCVKIICVGKGKFCVLVEYPIIYYVFYIIDINGLK